MAPSSVVGEAARQPMGNLYKLDGKMSSSYTGKLDREREDRRRGEGGVAKGGVPGKASGVAGQLNKNVQVSTLSYLCTVLMVLKTKASQISAVLIS